MSTIFLREEEKEEGEKKGERERKKDHKPCELVLLIDMKKYNKRSSIHSVIG